MKRLIIFAIIIWSICGAVSAQQPATHFEYPQAPDSLTSLQARTTYVIMHFWDKADMKKLMKDTTALNEAFADYAGFIPYAHPDSIKRSINALMAQFKTDAKSTIKLVNAAERWLFSPEAPFRADEQYLLFTRAALANKKVSAKEKERLMSQVKMINGSQPGAMAADVAYTTRHDATHHLADQHAPYTLLYIHDPADSDVSMTRLRLETDFAIKALIQSGVMKVVDLTVCPPTDRQWRSQTESLPYEWEVGASPNVGQSIDARTLPTMYLIDNDGRIVARQFDLDRFLNVASELYKQQSK